MRAYFFFMSGIIILLITLILVGSNTVCAQKHPHRKADKIVTFQGICGTVLVKRGNNMPSPDRPTYTGQPVEREVLIFPLLNISQVDAGENGFIDSVREVKPAKTVKSGKDGKFCVSLPAGRYSVVVREPQGLYANLFDSQNNIFPVNVQKNRRSDIKVDITHQAVF